MATRTLYTRTLFAKNRKQAIQYFRNYARRFTSKLQIIKVYKQGGNWKVDFIRKRR